MGKQDKRWWPMQEFLGRDMQRRNLVKEVFVDTTTLNHPDKRAVQPTSADGEPLGWSGSPPNLESGAPEREQTEHTSGEAYRERYALIDWSVS